MSNWDQFVANLKDFFNQPVPIIGCTIGFLLVFILVIFTKTSFGKKALKKMAATAKMLLSDFGVLKAETNAKVEELAKQYEEKKLIIESKVAVLEEVCLIIAENSHNAKVKEAMEQCKEKLSICKTDYETLVENRVKEESKKIEDELKAKYDDFYETYLKAQKEKIEQLVEQAEKSSETLQNKANSLLETKDEIVEVLKDEREEETDSNGTEE